MKTLLKQGKSLFLLLSLSLPFAACKKDPLKKAITLACTYTTDQRLTDHNPDGIDYIIECPVSVTAGTFTIEPGVSILVKTGSENGLSIQDNARLIAVGQANKPITFEGESRTPSWAGLAISSSQQNRVEYLSIGEAGQGSFPYYFCDPAALLLTGRGSIKNVTINRSAGRGISIGGGCIENVVLDGFMNNSINNCARYPIYLFAHHLNGVDLSNCTFSGNASAYNAVAIGSSDLRPGQHTISRADIPYLALFGLEISGSNNSLSIAPGTTIKFANNTSLFCNNSAALIANGTAQSPIVLEGEVSNPGHWDGVFIATTNTSNSLRYVTVADGGESGQTYHNSLKGNIYIGHWASGIGRANLDNITSLRSNSNCDVVFERDPDNAATISNSPNLRECRD